MPQISFILNDQTKVNSYGFSIETNGINLQRFTTNPVMLDAHFNSNQAVLGKWQNMRIENGQLKADPIFDVEDENAKNIKGKVDRGFISGCSMGILFNPNKLLNTGSSYHLQECELYEASIVPVPSNAGALKLYHYETKKLMSADEVSLCLTTIDSNHFNYQNNQMKKIQLSIAALVALGLEKQAHPTEGVDEHFVAEAINDLKSKLDASELKLSAATAALQTHDMRVKTENEVAALALVDSAIPNKADEAQRADLLKLAATDYAFAKRLIDGMPEKKSLAAFVNNKTNESKPGEIKNMEDFQQLTVAQQLAFKTEHSDAYKTLVANMNAEANKKTKKN